MTFRIIWLRAALTPVEEVRQSLVAAGEDVVPLAQAVARIDQLLAQNPLGQGESREPGERVLVEDPLTVWYEVDEAQQIVAVTTSVYRPGRA
ncbi:MAG: hypothetical protein K2X87_23820 [Gemmataceae bacterium]|nr:hypothetical protein [Gemmataceae bacterium]